jgi:exodeoxyribonuclease VII large subunit
VRGWRSARERARGDRTGRVTTYADRSKYQLIVERLEMAGEGALLKRIEELAQAPRRRGPVRRGRKRRLPFLPACVGVVTSDRAR